MSSYTNFASTIISNIYQSVSYSTFLKLPTYLQEYAPNYSFSSEMSKVAMTENSMERCLLDMPYELLFEILRRLPIGKLVEMSKLCSTFRDVVGNTHLWKDVYIKHEQKVVAFEELYSEPWPVKVIDLTGREIEPPVSSKTDQVVKVRELYLSSIRANKVTLEAILAKYQCTELDLSFNSVQDLGIAQEVFSKQTALEVLKLVHLALPSKTENSFSAKRFVSPHPCWKWLAPVLDNCKNLKELDLSLNNMSNSDMMDFVGNLPISLEKLSLLHNRPKDSFFKLLAERTPNLKELKLRPTEITECPSIVRFQFLEVLYILPDGNSSYQDNSDLYMYLIKFPALKTVYMMSSMNKHPETILGNLPTTLQPHGIIVKLTECSEGSPFPEDCTLWEV